MKIAMGIWIKGGKYVSKIFFNSKLQFWYLPNYSDSPNCIFLLHRHISADEIVCKLYDLRLDVFDGHCYNGGRVGCCRRTGNSNQIWHFEGIIVFYFYQTYHFFIIIFRVKIFMICYSIFLFTIRVHMYSGFVNIKSIFP